jgi:hypothetical protein
MDDIPFWFEAELCVRPVHPNIREKWTPHAWSWWFSRAYVNGVLASSERYKTNIAAMGSNTEKLNNNFEPAPLRAFLFVLGPVVEFRAGPLVTFLEYLHLRELKLHIPKLLRLRGDRFILRRKYPLLLLLEVTDLRSLLLHLIQVNWLSTCHRLFATRNRSVIRQAIAFYSARAYSASCRGAAKRREEPIVAWKLT